MPDALAHPAAFVDAMHALAQQTSATAIIPVTEAALLALLPHRDRFAGITIPFADADAFERISDKQHLLDSLIDREALCSTAMPGGVALCHPRRPIPSIIERQFLTLLRTERPVDFGAEDGEGTTLFFLLCTPDDRSHLHGLARLARVLNARNLEALRNASDSAEVLAILADAEAAVQTKA